MNTVLRGSVPGWLGMGDSSPARSRVTVGELLWVIAIVVASAIALSWMMGRDLNWDYFNYHAYAAHQVLGGGRQDFYAAGYQGYLNPAPYLPFALMEAAGWHSLAIGTVLAALHSLNVVFLYLIAREVTSSSARPRSAAVAVTLLGAASAPYLCQVGSTFADVTTTVPVMAAVWLTITRPGLRAGMLAVGLGGVAVALKWTNAPYALALLIAQAAVQSTGDWRGRTTRWAALVAATATGFALFYALWGWRLWREFASPVFPLFNQIFRAPYASTEPIALDRFVPQSLGELIALPFRMPAIEGWIYTEPLSPDIRPVVLLAVLAVATILSVWRSAKLRRWPASASRPRLLALHIFYLASLAAWIATSSNGRYAIPLLLLLGPLIYRAAARCIPDGAARTFVLLLALLQAAHVANAGNPRWGPQTWTHSWLSADVPESVRSEPALYVLVGRSSESYLAQHTHRDSVFTNPIGLISLPTDGPGWDRFVDLLHQNKGRTRVVMSANALVRKGRDELLNTYNELIDRLGLHLLGERCDAAQFNTEAPALGPWHVEQEAPTRPRHLLICDAVLKAAPDPVLAERRDTVHEIMDSYEAACPRFFSPRGVPTEGSSDFWTRLYGRFDLLLMVRWSSGEILYQQDRQATPVLIGTLQTWQEDVKRFQCRRPHNGSRGVQTLAGQAPNR